MFPILSEGASSEPYHRLPARWAHGANDLALAVEAVGRVGEGRQVLAEPADATGYDLTTAYQAFGHEKKHIFVFRSLGGSRPPDPPVGGLPPPKSPREPPRERKTILNTGQRPATSDIYWEVGLRMG